MPSRAFIERRRSLLVSVAIGWEVVARRHRSIRNLHVGNFLGVHAVPPLVHSPSAAVTVVAQADLPGGGLNPPT